MPALSIQKSVALSGVTRQHVYPSRENFPACLYFWDGHEKPGDTTVTDIVGGIVVASTVLPGNKLFIPRNRISFSGQTPIAGSVIQTGTKDIYILGVCRTYLGADPLIGCGVTSGYVGGYTYPDQGYWVSTYFGGVIGENRTDPTTNECVALNGGGLEQTTFGWAQLTASIPACAVKFDLDVENQGFYHSNPVDPFPEWELAQACPSSHTGAPSANGVTNPINSTYVLRDPSPTRGTVNVTGCANKFSLMNCESFCGAAIFAFDPANGVPADWKLATTWMAQQWYRSQVRMAQNNEDCQSTLWPGWIGKT